MQIAQAITLALAALIAAVALLRAARIARAVGRHDMLAPDTAGCCESLGFVGISAVCSGVQSIEHIEHLLGVEYDRYELIVVLDARLAPDAFRNIATRYGLIRVNGFDSDELPSAEVRALYRSRRRSYRRLVLVDRPALSPYEDLNAGTSVASYDYIMPVGGSLRLMPDAVETAAAAISAAPLRPELLRTTVGAPCRIFRRDAVIRPGGFSPRTSRAIPRSSEMRIPIPLCYNTSCTRRTRIVARYTIFALLAALLIVQTSLFGRSTALATAAVAALVLAAARYTAVVTSPQPCSVQTILCYIGRLRDLFGPQRFTVS